MFSALGHINQLAGGALWAEGCPIRPQPQAGTQAQPVQTPPRRKNSPLRIGVEKRGWLRGKKDKRGLAALHFLGFLVCRFLFFSSLPPSWADRLRMPFGDTFVSIVFVILSRCRLID